MNIKVVFVAENDPDFVSQKIMDKDNTNYSHVLIEYTEPGDNEYKTDTTKIFHAVGEGVCIVEGHERINFWLNHIRAHEFEVDLKCHYEYFLGYVRGSLGKQYALSQIAGIAVGIEADNDDAKMICSELVGIVITEMAGYEIPGDQDMWRPIHVYDALMDN